MPTGDVLCKAFPLAGGDSRWLEWVAGGGGGGGLKCHRLCLHAVGLEITQSGQIYIFYKNSIALFL